MNVLPVLLLLLSSSLSPPPPCLPALELSGDVDLIFSAASELGEAYSALGTAQWKRGCTAESIAAFQMAIIMGSAPKDPDQTERPPSRGGGERAGSWSRLLAQLARAQVASRDALPPAAAEAPTRTSSSSSSSPSSPSSPFSSSLASTAPGHGIAIVSLCDYDARLTNITFLSRANKARYAAMHGYPLFAETRRLDATRPPAWSKVLLVRKYLAYFDWVMWMDCDSFFQNHRLRLETLLPTGNSPNASPNSSSNSSSNDSPNADINLVISSDGVMVNTGVFLVKRSPWSFSFLDRLYGSEGNALIHHPWWEQAALHFLLNHNSTARGEAARHVRFVPQAWINSYPRDIAEKWRAPDEAKMGKKGEEEEGGGVGRRRKTGSTRPLHAVYEWGHRIISFSGCRVYFSAAHCEAQYVRFARLGQDLPVPAHVNVPLSAPVSPPRVTADLSPPPAANRGPPPPSHRK